MYPCMCVYVCVSAGTPSFIFQSATHTSQQTKVRPIPSNVGLHGLLHGALPCEMKATLQSPDLCCHSQHVACTVLRAEHGVPFSGFLHVTCHRWLWNCSLHVSNVCVCVCVCVRARFFLLMCVCRRETGSTHTRKRKSYQTACNDGGYRTCIYCRLMQPPLSLPQSPSGFEQVEAC